MLRNKGHRRTFKQNMELATMLSMAAGCVNVVGFLSFVVLTTNVTGHVAMFAEGLIEGNLKTAFLLLIWMLLFLAGAFSSTLLIHLEDANKSRGYGRTAPIALEILLLFLIGLYGHFFYGGKELEGEIMAGVLFFSMGMQNALVTVVSGSIVRTTHLTGLFTDLGIEIAQLVKGNTTNPVKLVQSIALHMAIIICFFFGALLGAFFYSFLGFLTFVFPVVLLLIALTYTPVKRTYYKIKKAERLKME